ncbi:hypothetical protein Ancab_003934 [Ancistrocladus abbreviatus]
MHSNADCVENIDAQSVLGCALFKDGKHTRLLYPLEKFHSDVAGRSFHNGRFTQRMREKAASLPKYFSSAFYCSTEVHCLVDVPGQTLPSITNGEMADHLKAVVAPRVPPELYDPFVAAVDNGNIRTTPNRRMLAAPHPTPGALLMGDAFNMRHPLTSGGITVALSDIVVLRNLLRPVHDLNDATSLHRYLVFLYPTEGILFGAIVIQDTDIFINLFHSVELCSQNHQCSNHQCSNIAVLLGVTIPHSANLCTQ